MPPASRITSILAEQATELARLQDAEARALLRFVGDARRELRERLSETVRVGKGGSFSAQHLRVALAQTEAAITTLTARMTGELTTAGTTAQRAALRDLLQTIRAHEGALVEAGARIEWGVAARMAKQGGLLLDTHSIARYGADIVARARQAMVIGMQTGASMSAIGERVASSSGVIASFGGRGQLIARMEMSNVYNASHHEALVEAAAVLDDEGTPDPLLRQADEYADLRNHPISRVIHGMVTAIDKPWLVPVAEVDRMADRLKKSATGILWPQSGAYYVVGRYAVHFGERGREIPYRSSWDGGRGLGWDRMTADQRAQLPAAMRRALR
jgi:hypothetical protein